MAIVFILHASTVARALESRASAFHPIRMASFISSICIGDARRDVSAWTTPSLVHLAHPIWFETPSLHPRGHVFHMELHGLNVIVHVVSHSSSSKMPTVPLDGKPNEPSHVERRTCVDGALRVVRHGHGDGCGVLELAWNASGACGSPAAAASTQLAENPSVASVGSRAAEIRWNTKQNHRLGNPRRSFRRVERRQVLRTWKRIQLLCWKGRQPSLHHR